MVECFSNHAANHAAVHLYERACDLGSRDTHQKIGLLCNLNPALICGQFDHVV